VLSGHLALSTAAVPGLQACSIKRSPEPPTKASHKTGASIPAQLSTTTARTAIAATMTGDSSSADLARRLRAPLI
jgi:hypothetical protein